MSKIVNFTITVVQKVCIFEKYINIEILGLCLATEERFYNQT